MKVSSPTNWFTTLVLFLCWFVLAIRVAAAEDKADGKDKIKELQKQRLEAATVAHDLIIRQYKQGFLPTSAVDTSGFLTQLLEVNKLVLQARLDLCDGKPACIKAIEETIKEVEPILAQLEKTYKSGIANSLVPYQLARVHLLELRITLAKAKQKTDGK